MASKKVPRGAAVLFGDLDAHEAELEELLEECGVHLLGLVHLADEGGDLGAGTGGQCRERGVRRGKLGEGRRFSQGLGRGCSVWRRGAPF